MKDHKSTFKKITTKFVVTSTTYLDFVDTQFFLLLFCSCSWLKTVNKTSIYNLKYILKFEIHILTVIKP